MAVGAASSSSSSSRSSAAKSSAAKSSAKSSGPKASAEKKSAQATANKAEVKAAAAVKPADAATVQATRAANQNAEVNARNRVENQGSQQKVDAAKRGLNRKFSVEASKKPTATGDGTQRALYADGQGSVKDGVAKGRLEAGVATIDKSDRTAKVFSGEVSGRAQLNSKGVGLEAGVKASALDIAAKDRSVSGRLIGVEAKAKAQFGPKSGELSAKVEGSLAKVEGRLAEDVTARGEFAKAKAQAGLKIGEDGIERLKASAGLTLVEGEIEKGKLDAKKSDDTKVSGFGAIGPKGGVNYSTSDRDGDGVKEYNLKVKIPLGPFGSVGFGVSQEGSSLRNAATNFARKAWNSIF